MAKQIRITYNKKEYILEYNRVAASNIESQGFDLSKVGSQPNLMIPLLVQGAFMMHNRGVKRSEINDVYEHIADKVRGDESILAVLMEMYSDTLTTLTDQAKDDEGNVATWEVLK
jgi:hypothetical protein